MSLGINGKLEQIIADLELIKKSLKIVPDKETTIADFDSNINSYEEFAQEDLKLEQITINNHKSAINGFLNHSHGIINEQTVKVYLDSNESVSWKSNQVKALRRYIRDYLKLGNWINQFTFAKTKTKLKKETPSNEQLAQFCSLLPYQIQMVFLVMLPSGLRIGEVLSLKMSNFDPDTNMMDASDIHKGDTKSSWISFITKQASEYLEGYLEQEIDYEAEDDPKMFSVSARSVQQAFKEASEHLGISINPHLLRTVFAERCREAKIDDDYINAFCGRTPQGMLARNYTDYSPSALRKQYDKVEPFLTLPFSES